MTSPAARLGEITGHVMLARCLGIAAELGLADLVAERPRTAAELAAATASHAGALYRMLRYLVAQGIFAEDDGGRFANTELSEPLRTGVAGSVKESVRTAWQDVVWDTFRHLPHTIATGAPAFDHAFGSGLFAYFAAHPDVGAAFDRAMARQSGPENDAVAASYPFGDFSVVMDVGGGRGGLLAAILARYPGVRGILFDQSHVLAEPSDLDAAGVRRCCDLVAGDFFKAVPPGADIYALKRILHDWTDAEAATILRHCASALRPDGRVLAIDAVIAPGNAPDPNKALDLGIMALTHGRERTAAEFQAVFAAAGLRVERIIPTPRPSSMSIVVGARA
ncbi:MAG: methyltransferase [Rhodospirillaceae bacterium]|nr:methyltransferase [Rhodospirillaceae bacterium]